LVRQLPNVQLKVIFGCWWVRFLKLLRNPPAERAEIEAKKKLG